MKMLKKMFAVICSVAIAASMVTGVSAATIDNPLSMDITDNQDNTVTVDIKTSLDSISSFTGYVKVPEALKPYISSWTWSTDVPASSLEDITYNYDYITGSNTAVAASYILASFVGASGNSFAVPDDDILVSIKISLVEGGIPATVAEADRTLTLGGEYAGTTGTKKKGATTLTTSDVAYYLINGDNSKTPANTFDFDVTAEGNYVVVPVAEAEDEGPAYEGYVGDDDETDVAVGATFDFVPEETTTGIKWTVETNDGVKKSHVSAIDAAGAASYKLGLVIQGLAKSAVKSISAVLQ